MISIFKYNRIILINYFELNKHYLNININLDSYFHSKNLTNRIKIGTFNFYLENGGRARTTSLLFNYLCRFKILNLYLFTIKIKDDNEYLIQRNINRILIKNYALTKLIRNILKKRINIFIYQHYYSNEIETLNKLKNVKILNYQHQSVFFWIYSNFTSFLSLYRAYKKSKYIISLIHLENDYIFKKWGGFKTILMNNFITYEYNLSFPLDLSSKIILMIGRADDRYKRFELGIQAMEYVTNELPENEMKIITNITNILYINNIINNLSLEDKIKFYGYNSQPEKYFRNISLHIITSISESFSLVLCETKIYGIPNILIGLDYISIGEGGVVIIYDDSPEFIAKECIKILINDKYRRKLGKNARKSMKKYKNIELLKKWIILILSIYYGYDYYGKLIKLDIKITENKAIRLLINQIEFLKKRKKFLQNITLNNFENFSFFENINFIP